MVHFVGAGSGAPDLITVRGARLLGEADIVIYAGSLVNPALLDATKPGCEIHDSAKMTLEEVIAVIRQAEAEGKTTVRLHTGDSSTMALCGSSLTRWKSWASTMMSAPASAPSAGPPRRSARNIRSRTSAKRSSSRAHPAAHPFLSLIHI